MINDKIRGIPTEITLTYVRILVNYRPQKADPNCVRLTLGGNTLNITGYFITKTADLTTSKILWNSVFSTKYARFACIDMKNMYLQIPMTDYEYL